MVDVAVDELRELSRRAKRAHACGAIVIVSGMLLFPAQMALSARWPSMTTALALAGFGLVGALFVRYAYVAGQARGAFRRVFHDLRERKRATAAQRDAAREPAKEPARDVEPAPGS